MKSEKSKNGRPPIRSLEELRICHGELDQRIRQYLVSWKPDISDQVRKALELRAARELNAANPFSRIQIATCLERELQAHFLENQTRAAFFVTLISELHAVKADDKKGYDAVSHREWIASLLEGYDYVGMIEPAYYRDVAFMASREHWISWHAHLIVWNIEKPILKKMKSAVNDVEVAFRPDGLPFHFRKASQAEIEPEIVYICKSPRSEYQAYRPARTADTQTPPQSHRVKQNKREIRTGNLLAVLSALSDKTIKLLTIAGGAGKAIRKQSLKSARRALEDDYSKHKHRLRKL